MNEDSWQSDNDEEDQNIPNEPNDNHNESINEKLSVEEDNNNIMLDDSDNRSATSSQNDARNNKNKTL